MKRVTGVCGAITALVLLLCSSVHAQILNVVETGGDNEPTDTITAKWTGQTFPVSVAGEPTPSSTIGQIYTVPAFGNQVPSYVDRNHRYMNDPGTGGGGVDNIPAYLIGAQYIMSGNDNRDNATYRLDVTVDRDVIAYMLIDNRMSASTATDDPNDPPAFDTTHMQWILDQGWVATANGLNRLGSTARPDEVAIDEGADGTINNWFSVYSKQFPAGTFSLFQADNAGQNMYGVVITGVPEPTSLLGLATVCVLGLARRRRA